MELPKDSKMTSPISEYEESKERFQSFTKGKRSFSSYDGSGDDTNYLDDIIQRLCSKDKSLDIGHDSSLFYELLLHSDFIQIKNELLESFYSELLKKSIQNNILNDIVENLEKLEVVPHVKKFFIGQLFKIFQLSPVVKNDSLILDYSKGKIWYDVNLDNINSITMRPGAYKLMLSNEEFSITSLNFLIRICKVKRLILSGCNLNGRNVQALFHELKLESLNLSECGTCVNKIIQDNTSGILDNLKELDVSENPLLNKTLESLRWIPLNDLNISNCIKSSGKFFNSIWFANCFASQMRNIEGEEGKGNIDILWEVGVLRETIEILNISSNVLSKTNLQLILQSQLKELDIRRCLDSNCVKFLDVVFPKTLKILKAQMNMLFFEDFKILSRTCLEKLEMDYHESTELDFSDLYNSSLTKTLEELTIGVLNFSPELMSFISSIKLKYFCCQYARSSSEIIPSYISNPNLDKSCLQTLKFEGNGYKPISCSIQSRMISEILKFRNLQELYLHACETSDEMNLILSCDNLHESIKSLKLAENYYITDDNSMQILKFKKLNKLSFTFMKDISYHNLKKIVEMNTVKEFILTAVILKETLSLAMARLICLAPINTLEIFGAGNITDEAFNYLMDETNFFGLSKHLVTFISVDCVIMPNLASVLKKVNWEEVLLLSCSWKETAFEIFLSNEYLTLSLNYFCLCLHEGKNWKQESFQKLCTKLKTDNLLFHYDTLALKPIPISEFLFSLSLEPCDLEEDKEYLLELLKSNMSIIDYDLGPRLTHYYYRYASLNC